MRLQAVIFDMDGVLSDTERMHGIAQEKMLKEYAVDLPAEECSRRFAGIPESVIWPTVFEEAGLPCPSVDKLMEKKIKVMLELLQDGVPAIPGVHDLLNRLQALKLKTAVASSAAPTLIDFTLKGLSIDSIVNSVTSGHEVENGKPAPDVFLLAAKKLAVDPTACLVIEDAHAGVKAAKAAGMICIGYKAEESQQDLSKADKVVKSMNEITKELLESL